MKKLQFTMIKFEATNDVQLRLQRIVGQVSPYYAVRVQNCICAAYDLGISMPLWRIAMFQLSGIRSAIQTVCAEYAS